MKILSFDGGGVRGLVSVSFLAFMEKFHPEKISWRKQFDIFTGTSAGAFIALALAVTQISCADLVVAVHNLSKFVFVDQHIEGPLLHSKYSNVHLRKQLKKLFGTLRLGNVIPHKRVLIPTYNLSARRFEMFDSDIHKHVLCVDVAMASAAVPGILQSVNVGGSWFLDGGIVLNNPSAYVLSLVLRGEKTVSKNENIKLLSIGTGRSCPKMDGPNDWGLIQWGRAGLIQVLFDSSPTDTICSNLLPVNNFLRVNGLIPTSLQEIDNVTELNIARLVKLGFFWYKSFREQVLTLLKVNKNNETANPKKKKKSIRLVLNKQKQNILLER